MSARAVPRGRHVGGGAYGAEASGPARHHLPSIVVNNDLELILVEPRKKIRRRRRSSRLSPMAELTIFVLILIFVFLLGIGFWAAVLWVGARLIGIQATGGQILGLALFMSVLTSSVTVRR